MIHYIPILNRYFTSSCYNHPLHYLCTLFSFFFISPVYLHRVLASGVTDSFLVFLGAMTLQLFPHVSSAFVSLLCLFWAWKKKLEDFPLRVMTIYWRRFVVLFSYFVSIIQNLPNRMESGCILEKQNIYLQRDRTE